MEEESSTKVFIGSWRRALLGRLANGSLKKLPAWYRQRMASVAGGSGEERQVCMGPGAAGARREAARGTTRGGVIQMSLGLSVREVTVCGSSMI